MAQEHWGIANLGCPLTGIYQQISLGVMFTMQAAFIHETLMTIQAHKKVIGLILPIFQLAMQSTVAGPF